MFFIAQFFNVANFDIIVVLYFFNSEIFTGLKFSTLFVFCNEYKNIKY